MKNFKVPIALSLLGAVLCSCSPTTSSLNARSPLSNKYGKPARVNVEAARPYSQISRSPTSSKTRNSRVRHVRTTSYSHAENEKGGIYGRKNAIGTTLLYGKIRSAAADWSRYPLGTKFRIVGQPHLYVIDDYGSALVGTDTIDIYKPNLSMMRAWGVRNIDIEIVEWGCYKSSYSLLSGRKHAAPHCWQMYKDLKPKVGA
ncbi:MAG: 3D (Asp-Asp-Asp) domain-containing protein [Verrucomicrobiales bacterium]|jgi:3D (Asp-Asp-Asp) domain-containing protein